VRGTDIEHACWWAMAGKKQKDKKKLFMKPTVKSLPTFFACDLCRALVAGTLFWRFFYNTTPFVEERNGFSCPTIKHQHTSVVRTFLKRSK